MGVAVLDIETFASMDELSYSEYRYLKTRGREERSDEDLAERLALNPYVLHVVSYALAFVDHGTIERVVVQYISGEGDEESWEERDTFTIAYFPVICSSLPQDLPQGERVLLEGLWRELRDATLIVTYNGQNFDLPVLRIRSMVHNLDIPPYIAAPRPFRFSENHLDLADFLSPEGREHRYTLEFVCRRFGIDFRKKGLDGSKIHNAFCNGYYFDIARYNAEDAIATALLFLRLERYIPREAPSQEQAPTERQLQHLSNLLTLRYPERAITQAFVLLAEEGILTKSTASRLIDRLKE